MKHTLPTSSGFSRFIIFSIFVWLVLLWLQSSYIVVIGGPSYLFWTSLGLLVLNGLSVHSTSFKNKLALIVSAGLVIYLGANSLFCAYLILGFYSIFFLYSGYYRYKKLIKLIGLFVIMIVFALYQAQSLQELEHHYAAYETGETWQKYGAL